MFKIRSKGGTKDDLFSMLLTVLLSLDNNVEGMTITSPLCVMY